MEKQKNQGKTPENEEKKNHDYTQLRKYIDDAEKRGLSFFFIAADDELVIQVADCKKGDLVHAIAHATAQEPSLRELFTEALAISIFTDKVMD